MKFGSLLLILSAPLSVLAVRPDIPTDFRTTEESSEYIAFTWSSVPEAIGYRLYRNTEPLLSVVGTQIADGDLDERAVYGYTISAYNDSGESRQSEVLLVRVPDGAGPVISHIFPADTARVNASVQYLTFTTDEPATCTFNMNGDTFTATGQKAHIAELALVSETWHTVDFVCVDETGNGSAIAYQVEVVQDLSLDETVLTSIQQALDELAKQVGELARLVEMHTSTAK